MATEIVKYNNDLNKVPFNRFHSTEMDLFFAICSKMRDKSDSLIVISFDEIRRMSNYIQVGDARFIIDVERTYDKYLDLKIRTVSDTGIIEKFTLFEGFRIDPLERDVSIKIRSEFAYMLNDLASEFTAFELDEFTSLKSGYVKTLYRLLKQWRTVGRKYYEINEFKKLMAIPKKYRTGDIDRRVLNPALEELPAIFKGFKFEKEKKGRGGSVTGITFTFKKEEIPDAVTVKDNKIRKTAKPSKGRIVESEAAAEAMAATGSDTPIPAEVSKEISEMLAKIRANRK